MPPVNNPVYSAKQRIKETLQLGRALNFVWECARGWTLANGLLLILQGFLPLLSLYLMKLTVDAVSAGLANSDKDPALRQVGLLILLLGLTALFSTLIRSASALIRERQSQAVTDHMTGVLQEKSVTVDLEYYESARYYDTLHRAQQEAPFRPTRLINGLSQIAQNGISMLALAGLLWSFHWSITAVLFLAVLPGIAVRLRYAEKMHARQREQTSAERQAAYLNWILTGSSHAKEVRLLNLGPHLMSRYRELRQKLRREQFKMEARRTLAETVAQTGATLAIYGAYLFIAYRTLNGITTLGDLVMYFSAFQRGQGFLQECLAGLAGLYEDQLFISNLYEFLDLKNKVTDPVEGLSFPRPINSGIVFERVSFRYPDSSRKVLQDISLTIEPGQVIALVGENGSGKTTLIKLLCRFYDPTEGRITLDGNDLGRFKKGELRNEISVLFQDYTRYHMTALENIRFGDITLPPNHKKIFQAARSSGADEVISSLPFGYETTLGKWFQDGEELSVGEWQKIALARAFVRDTPIIVLDEPTSSLDAETEFIVFQKFRQLAVGRTAILISHRFSTVRMADV
ncbi:MAG TPA: ABC transporter ATP-binding protein, partial [Thermodesulfobacteriota bacterium]|nr:ABC transporter ATP-binding protein [Thermodesulfobacteriota bacterium]